MTTAATHLGIIGLRVPGSLGYRHLAIRLVTTACKMALESDLDGVDPDFEPEVVSAFGEAFNNVALHGYRGVAPEPVQIEVDWDHDRLVITMMDSGHTFDPSTIAPPNLDDLPENGMGLFIMRSCLDEIDYQPGPPNVLRLVKSRRQRDGFLPPEPTASGVGLSADAVATALGRNVAPGNEHGTRGSNVAVVSESVVDLGGTQRSGHSAFRLKAVGSDEAREISRRR